jgi:hypothetical protein
MTYKKLLACLIVMSVSTVIGVKAQDAPANVNQNVSPEKVALIKELIEVSHAKQTVEAMLKAQSEQMEERFPEIIWEGVSGMEELKTLTPAQKEELRLRVFSNSARTGRRMYELLMQKIDFDKLLEDISVPLYDKYFTEAELRDLVSFHQSPTGKKVIEVMPNLVVESMTRTADIIAPRIGEMMKQLQQEETQLMTKEIQTAVKAKQKPTKSSGRTTSRHPRP